jgi:proton-dependent oligopeptide transporter, POT family
MTVQWRAMARAPRELWIVFSLKFLSSYAYFSFALVLTIFLTEEFGLSDNAAGWAYGMYGVMSTIFGFVCGWIIDYMGVRASLLTGAVVGAGARFVLAFTRSHRTAQIMLYTALPFSECLGIPIMTIGIKRYTNAHNRTFAFSVFYSMMNVAALCAGPLVDLSRSRFSAGVLLDLRPFGLDGTLQLSALRIIVLSSAVAAAAMLLGVLAGIREIEVDDSGNVTRFEPDRSDGAYAQTMAVLREPAFWRLTVFTLLIVGVRLVFRHLDATMPKYLVRQFGPDAPFGMVYSINPMLVIWMVPLVALFTRSVDSYNMILAGSFISALSPFWICAGPHYWAVILFMVTLSVGEAVYSPRVYEYTMEVSGRGVEGLYSSLSAAPLFSVKLLVGGMSGWLLTSFMPADDPAARNGAMLWGIVGLTSLTSPLLMLLFKDYISPPEAEEERAAARSKSNSCASLLDLEPATAGVPDDLDPASPSTSLLVASDKVAR